MVSEIKKRGRPKKVKEEEVVVQRPIKMGAPVKPEAWDGKFKSVETLKHQKPALHRQERYRKWNHHATINWIMGQADPVGFLADVMQGKEIFPVYTKDSEGLATKAGNISAVEVKAQIEEKKVLDISKLNNDDLNAIERVLEHAVIDASPSREDEEIPQGVHKELLAND